MINYRLKTLAFSITNKCNLNCSFCSKNSGCDVSDLDLNIEVIKEVINKTMSDTQIENIAITGGEPFLHSDFKELLNWLHQKKLNIIINSNLTLLDESMLDVLVEYNVSRVITSIESYDRKKHDKLRGKAGAFKKTVSGINMLTKNNIEVTIKTTAGTDNVNDIYKNYLFANRLKVNTFSFGRTIPTGRAAESKEDKKIWKLFQKQGVKCSKKSKHLKTELSVEDPLKHFFDRNALKLKTLCGYDFSELSGGCTVGKKFLYIHHNGDILGCPALPKKLGNINYDSLYQVWQESDILNQIRLRELLSGACKTCGYTRICGGCRAYAYALTNNVYGEDSLCPIIHGQN